MNVLLAPAFSLPPASAPPLVAVMAGLEGSEDVVLAEGVAARAINKLTEPINRASLFSMSMVFLSNGNAFEPVRAFNDGHSTKFCHMQEICSK